MRAVFPRLKSNPKAEVHRNPRDEVSFARECRMPFRNIPVSSDLSRPRKELYRELMMGSASDPLMEQLPIELGARLELLEQLRVLAHLAACPECVGPQRLGFQSVLDRHARLFPLRQRFKENGFACLLLLRAGSPVLESCRGVDSSHQLRATRAARR